MTDSAQPVVVLLVEDDPADELLTVESRGEHKLTNRVHVGRDGHQALRFLHRHGPYSEVPRPDLILLDVHLPRYSESRCWTGSGSIRICGPFPW